MTSVRTRDGDSGVNYFRTVVTAKKLSTVSAEVIE